MMTIVKQLQGDVCVHLPCDARGFRSLVLQCVCGVYAGDYAHIPSNLGEQAYKARSERACVFSGVRMFGCSVCVCVNLSV